MRIPVGLVRRGVWCVPLSLMLSLVLPSAVATPAPQESSRIPFAERFRAVQHGGLVRAANSSITCRSAVAEGAKPCSQARSGAGTNGDYEMFYSDVDSDPNTYNSTRAELRIPSGSRVSYARLYWGGNLRVGEQKPPEDNGRVLIAEPGGQYQELLADTTIGHRTTGHTDGYQASADVTRLVRESGPGYYTVAQVNVAMGHSRAGAWGGWTLVVAYENSREPMRHLAIWDGFESLGSGRDGLSVRIGDMKIPARASGHAGIVAYNGDRHTGNDTLSVGTGKGGSVRLGDGANPVNDVMNSTIAEYGRNVAGREPDYMNTLGYDSDVFDIGPALKSGGSGLDFRFGTGNESYQVGALFVQADTIR
jgi:Protein of unknown function (DUF3344)